MSLYKNTSLILVGTLIANILAYVFNILVARKIGPELYGVLGALLALFSLTSWIYMSLFSGITKQVAHLKGENKSYKLSTFYFTAQREVMILLLAISLFVIFGSSALSTYFNIPSISLVIITGFLIWVNGMQYFYQSVLCCTIIDCSRFFIFGVRTYWCFIGVWFRVSYRIFLDKTQCYC